MQSGRVAADLAYLATPGTLTPRELTLLMILAQRQGKPDCPQQFCRLMAPPDPVQFRRALKHAMSRLRQQAQCRDGALGVRAWRRLSVQSSRGRPCIRAKPNSARR
jgi:DNA-binding response OmpR family regulator